MDVFALVSFFIMGTATLSSLSLLVCLVVLETDPRHPAAVPAKPYRRRKGLMERHAPTARRAAAQAKAPRKAVLPSSHKRQAPTRGSGRA
jgi:hypothetical protein